MQYFDFDVAVIGAGVIGAAIARAAAESGRKVLLLERHSHPGTEVSSRNSGVIHAGLYYPPGSAKAQMCVRGREMLLRYVRERDVLHRLCGKYVVATAEAEVATLEMIEVRARANGVETLRMVDGAEVSRHEPAVRAVAALDSPGSGAVDAHGLIAALLADAEIREATVVFHAPVTAIRPLPGGFAVDVGGQHDTRISAREVVTATGLGTEWLTRAIEGYPEAAMRRQYLAKGHYYRFAGRPPFRRHIYPVPVPGGLGTHATLDLDGIVRFGPDVEWVDRIDYDFGADRRAAFHASISRWFAALRLDDLVPDYTGIRPKIVPAGTTDEDFRIDDHRHHGLDGLVVLQGIESPGLTSSLAIAEAVLQQLR